MLINKYIKTILLSITITLSFCGTYLISTSIFAGKFDTYTFFGRTKDSFTITQIIGYFIGKIIGSIFLNKDNKLFLTLLMYLISTIVFIPFIFCNELAQIILIFISSIPMSLFWGFTIFYVEGVFANEAIIIVLYMGFLMSGGISKTIGTYISYTVKDENYMPFICAFIGLIFSSIMMVITDIIYNLECKDTNKEIELEEVNKKLNTAYTITNATDSKQFIKIYWLPIILIGFINGILLGLRNYKDFYTMEMIVEMTDGNLMPAIYSISDIIISIATTAVYIFLVFIKKPIVSLYTIFFSILINNLIVVVVTMVFQVFNLNIIFWWIVIGVNISLAFIPTGALIYVNFMKATNYNISSVRLIYLADAYGPIVCVIFIIIKNIFLKNYDYIFYFGYITLGASIIVSVLTLLTIISFYFIHNNEVFKKEMDEYDNKMSVLEEVEVYIDENKDKNKDDINNNKDDIEKSVKME